jgi:hypothetical protein
MYEVASQSFEANQAATRKIEVSSLKPIARGT